MTNATQYHPAWYQFEQGKAISNVNLIDSLNDFFNYLDSQMDILNELQYAQALGEDSVPTVAHMLMKQVMEAKALINMWHAQKPKNIKKEIPVNDDTDKEPIKVELDQEVIDIALQIQGLGEEARNFAIAFMQATIRREARGDNFKPQDYKSRYMESENNITSCINTFEQIKALGDLLVLSTEGGSPSFFDNTLENVGQLIIDRIKPTLEEINPEPVSEEEEAA